MGKSLSIIAITLSIYNVASVEYSGFNKRPSVRSLLRRKGDKVETDAIEMRDMTPANLTGTSRDTGFLEQPDTSSIINRQLTNFDRVMQQKISVYVEQNVMTQDVLSELITFSQYLRKTILQMSGVHGHAFSECQYSKALQEIFIMLRFHPKMTDILQQVLLFDSSNAEFNSLIHRILNAIVFEGGPVLLSNTEAESSALQVMLKLQYISRSLITLHKFKIALPGSKNYYKSIVFKALYKEVYSRAETMKLVPDTQEMLQIQYKNITDIIEFGTKYPGAEFMVFNEQFLRYDITVNDGAAFGWAIFAIQEIFGDEYPAVSFELLKQLLRSPKLVLKYNLQSKEPTTARIIKYLRDSIFRYYENRIEYQNSGQSYGLYIITAKEMGLYLEQKRLFDAVVCQNPNIKNPYEIIEFSNWYKPLRR